MYNKKLLIMKSKGKVIGGYSLGIPGVVVGVLLALKHIGMTNISYWGILLYGFEIWLCCAAISLAIVFAFCAFSRIKYLK